MQIPYGGCHGIAAVIDNEWEKINDTEMQKIKMIMNRKITMIVIVMQKN